jgi:hypothetical protein
LFIYTLLSSHVNILVPSSSFHVPEKTVLWLDRLFFAKDQTSLLRCEHDWSNVLVIGERKQNPDEDRSIKTLVQLAGYRREVFGSQPERRFVPGFTICGSLMRLWVFDRSGPYTRLYVTSAPILVRLRKLSTPSQLSIPTIPPHFCFRGRPRRLFGSSPPRASGCLVAGWPRFRGRFLPPVPPPSFAMNASTSSLAPASSDLGIHVSFHST